MEERGLAGAVWSEQERQLLQGELHRDVPDGPEPAEAQADELHVSPFRRAYEAVAQALVTSR